MKIIRWGTVLGAVAALAFAAPAAAHHATPTATVVEGECGETTIATAWPDDVADHRVDTAALVVLVDGEVTTAAIGETVTVGPFEADTTVQWRLWGGGERDYDDPPLADLEALLAHLDQGGSELTDAPGVAWHSLEVTGCPEPDPTTPPTTAPPADDEDDAGGTGGESPAPGAGAELPTTGVPTWGLAAAGGALLLAGGGAVLVGRRRRVRVVTE